MAQYIDKSALVAEIEDLWNAYKKCPTHNSYEEGLKNGRLIGYKDALHKINTIEVKEVDLKKSISDWLLEGLPNDEELIDYIKETAEHFFELGMSVNNKAQKGEEV